MKNRTHVDKLPTVLERDTAQSRVKCIDASNVPSDTQSTERICSIRGGEFYSKPSMPDCPYALESTRNLEKTLQSTVFPPGLEEHCAR